MTHPRILAVITAAALLLVGCGAPQPTATPATPDTFDLLGVLEVSQAKPLGEDGKPCLATGGYDDIEAGVQVRVTDSAGEVVALGELLPGVAKDNYPTVPGTDTCRFLFVVGDIPGQVGDIFGVEVGNRGSVNFEVDDEMTSVTLTLS